MKFNMNLKLKNCKYNIIKFYIIWYIIFKKLKITISILITLFKTIKNN